MTTAPVDAPAAPSSPEAPPPAPERRRSPVGRFAVDVGFRVLALVALVTVWAVAVQLLDDTFLPSPSAVWEALRDRFTDGDTVEHVAITSRRVAIAAVLSGIAGVALGVLMGLSRAAESLLLPYVVLALGIPGPVYIIMSLLVMGIGETSTMTALVLSVAPFVTNIAFQGVAARERRLDEMSRVYRLDRRSRLQNVILPQITPTLLAAGRTSFALSWKLVVLMEALSTPNGIGSEILRYFRLLQPAQVVAYVIIFVIIMMVVEVALFKQVERWLLRWQAPSTYHPAA